jgi:hypothetical protein
LQGLQDGSAAQPHVHLGSRRFPALQQLDVSACRRVSNDELAHLHMMTNLRSVVLSGCEDVSDEGLLHLAPLTYITSLNLANCCKVAQCRVRCRQQLMSQVAERQCSIARPSEGCLSVTVCCRAAQRCLPGIGALVIRVFLPRPQVTDAGLQTLAALTQLCALDLSGCVSVTERGIGAAAAALRRLRALKLGGTSRVATISDASLACVSSLTSLTHLDLSGSHDITDAGAGFLQCQQSLL